MHRHLSEDLSYGQCCTSRRDNIVQFLWFKKYTVVIHTEMQARASLDTHDFQLTDASLFAGWYCSGTFSPSAAADLTGVLICVDTRRRG